MTKLPVGKVIRNLREHAGMYQWELAEKMGASRNYVSQLERGKINPPLEALIRISDALRLPVWGLVHKIKSVADGTMMLTPPAKIEPEPASPRRAKPEPPTPTCRGCGGERAPGRFQYCDTCREYREDEQYNKPIMDAQTVEVPDHIRQARREYDRLMARGKFRDAERLRQQMMQDDGYQIPTQLDQEFQRVSA